MSEFELPKNGSHGQSVLFYVNCRRFVLLSVFFSLLFCAVSCSRLEEKTSQNAGKRAEECFRNGDYICAVKEWTILADQGRADAFVYERIGDAQKKLGNFPAALDAYKKSTDLAEDSMSAWEKRAEIEIFFADLPSAEASLAQIDKLGRTAKFYVLKGDLLSLQGKDKEAETQYRTLLDTDSDNITALTRLLFSLFSQGKHEETENIYDKLDLLAGTDPDGLESMARYLYARGVFDRACRKFEKAVALQPDNQEIKIKLARFYLDAGRYDQAHEVFHDLLAANPDNTFAKKMCLETSMLSGDMERAREEIESLSEEEKGELEFAILNGKYHLMQHALPQAVSCFQEAIDQEPELVVAHYLLGVTYLAMGHGNLGKSELVKALSLDRSFCYAELALSGFFYKKGQLDIAYEYADRVREKEPGNVRAFLLLGAVNLAKGDLKQAAKMYRVAKALDPSLNIPDYYGAMIAASALGTVEAEDRYQKFIDECPECMDALYNYLMLLVKAGKVKEAEEFVAGRVAAAKDNPWLHAVVGEFFLKRNRLDSAMSEFRKLIELVPYSVYGYQRLIKLMMYDADKRNELEVVLSEAVKRDSCNVPDVFMTLSRIYTDSGRMLKAVEVLEEAKSRMPGNADITNNLAWHYLMPETENIPRAFALALEANELAPDRADIMDTLAWVYYYKGLYTQAHWLLEACLEQGDDSPVIHYHLGMVYAAEDRFDDAEKHLLIAKNTEDPYVAKNRMEIDSVLKKIQEKRDAARKKKQEVEE